MKCQIIKLDFPRILCQLDQVNTEVQMESLTIDLFILINTGKHEV